MTNRMAKISTTQTPDGKVVPTADLVDRMRRFGGKLTAPQMCEALGWTPEKRSLSLIWQLRDRWRIPVADWRGINVDGRESKAKQAAQAVVEAAAARMREIEAAKAEAASGKVPPYRPSVELLDNHLFGADAGGRTR